MQLSLPNLKWTMVVALMLPLAGTSRSEILELLSSLSSAVNQSPKTKGNPTSLALESDNATDRFGGIFSDDVEDREAFGFQIEGIAAPFTRVSVPVGDSRAGSVLNSDPPAVLAQEFGRTAPVCELWPSAPWVSSDRFWDQAASAKFEYGGMFAAITAIGIFGWDWGSSGFRFSNEGWFGDDTSSGGMDKFGHAFTSYLLADVLNDAILRNSSDPRGGQFTAAAMSISLMTYVELFDGFSSDHGFSYEDMVVDVLGAGFSVFRNTVPGVREKIDFRLQYLPSEYSGFEPFGDYAGQKYFVVVKLAGFEALRESPLRYVELHGGYCARGFLKEERQGGADREQNVYVGIGLNLQELLFGAQNHPKNVVERFARRSLEYIQVPYTYVSSGGNSGR